MKQEYSVICPYCHAENPARSRKCLNCGMELSKNQKVSPLLIIFLIIIATMAFLVIRALTTSTLELSPDEFRSECREVSYKEALKNAQIYDKIKISGYVNQQDVTESNKIVYLVTQDGDYSAPWGIVVADTSCVDEIDIRSFVTFYGYYKGSTPTKMLDSSIANVALMEAEYYDINKPTKSE